MNYSAKICPRCNTELQQKEGAFELVRRGIAGAYSFITRIPATRLVETGITGIHSGGETPEMLRVCPYVP